MLRVGALPFFLIKPQGLGGKVELWESCYGADVKRVHSAAHFDVVYTADKELSVGQGKRWIDVWRWRTCRNHA